MRKIAIWLIVALTLVIPARALGSASGVIRDCADDGKLEHHYSRGDLEKARGSIPSDLNEYSDCQSVIAGAIDRLGGGHHGGAGGSGGSGASSAAAGGSPAQRARIAAADAAALARARHGDKGGVQVGGHRVEPGSNGLFETTGGSGGLPTPLLLALIAVAVLLVGGAFAALRGRVPALAQVPLPRLSQRVRLPRPRLPRFRR
jgi:hypothetical protein